MHYQIKHNENDAYRVAKLKSKKISKRFKLTDDDGSVLEMIDILINYHLFIFVRKPI